MHIEGADTYVASSLLCPAVMLHSPAMAARRATIVGDVRLIDKLPLVTPRFLGAPVFRVLLH